MAGDDVFIKASALRELESVGSRKLRQNLAEHIQALANNPRPLGCRKLSSRDQYRIRRGACRVVYSIEDERRTVLVVKIGHRKDVYRQSAPMRSPHQPASRSGDYRRRYDASGQWRHDKMVELFERSTRADS